jgi:hypothetical protein
MIAGTEDIGLAAHHGQENRAALVGAEIARIEGRGGHPLRTRQRFCSQ